MNTVEYRYVHAELNPDWIHKTWWFSSYIPPNPEHHLGYYLEKTFLRIEMRVKGHYFRPPVHRELFPPCATFEEKLKYLMLDAYEGFDPMYQDLFRFRTYINTP